MQMPSFFYKAFGTAFHRACGAAVLAAPLLAGCAPARAPASAAAAPPQTEEAAPDPLASLKQVLAALRQEKPREARRHEPSRLIPLDSAELDGVITTQTLEPGAAVKALLQKQSSYDAPDGLAAALAQEALARAPSVLGAEIFYVTPVAMFDVKARVCVLLQTPDNSLSLVGGMAFPRAFGPEAAAHFFNDAAEWRCRDEGTDLAFLEKFHSAGAAVDTPRRLMESPVALTVMSELYRYQAFAETAAAGDRVREGAPMEFISAVAGWRGWGARQSDPIHCTAPALESLYDVLQEKGTEAFRALPDENAENIYRTVAGEGGLSTPVAVLSFLAFMAGTPAEREYILTESNQDEEIQHGLSVAMKYYAAEMPPPDYVAEALLPDPEAPAAQAALEAWDVEADFAARAQAAAHGGLLTPETAQEVYAAWRRELEERAESSGDLAARMGPSLARTMFMERVLQINHQTDLPPGLIPVTAAPRQNGTLHMPLGL